MFAASTCVGTNVRSRAICSASANARAEPSFIGISSAQSQNRASMAFGKSGLRWFFAETGNGSVRGVAVTPAPAGAAPATTTRRKR